MATSQQVIKTLRDAGIPEEIIAKKVTALGGSYSPPISPTGVASTGVANTTVASPNLSAPQTGSSPSAPIIGDKKTGLANNPLIKFFASAPARLGQGIGTGLSNLTNSIGYTEDPGTQALQQKALQMADEAERKGDLEGARRLREVANKSINTNEGIVSERALSNQEAGKDIFKGAVGSAGYLIPGGKGLTAGAKALLGVGRGAVAGFGASETGNELGATLGGGLIGGGLSLAGSAIGYGAKKVGEGGKNLLTKAFHKSAVNNFKKKTGEEMANFIQRNKLKGNYTEESQMLVDKFQKNFDKLARESGVKIKAKDVQNSFNTLIKELKATGLSKNIKMADKLKKEVVGIIQRLGKEFDISDLTQARLDADKLTSFSNTKASQGLYKNVRDALQKTVQNAVKGKTAGGLSLEELGKELSKIYVFKDIATKMSSFAKGGKALSLTSILASGLGGAVGGFPGMVGGYLANEALSSPMGTNLASKGLENIASPLIQGAGSVLSNPTVQRGIVNAVTPSEMNTVPQEQVPQEQVQQGTQGLDTGGLASPTGQTMGGQIQQEPIEPQTRTGYTEQEIYDAMLKAQQAGDTASYKQLRQMYEDEAEFQTQLAKGGGGKAIPATQVTNMADVQSSISQMSALKTTINEYKDIMGPIGGRLKSLDPYNTRAQTFQANMTLVAQLVGKALEGGVLRAEDVKKYLKILPQITDTPEIAQGKIDNVMNQLNVKLSETQRGLESAGYNKQGTIMDINSLLPTPNTGDY